MREHGCSLSIPNHVKTLVTLLFWWLSYSYSEFVSNFDEIQTAVESFFSRCKCLYILVVRKHCFGCTVRWPCMLLEQHDTCSWPLVDWSRWPSQIKVKCTSPGRVSRWSYRAVDRRTSGSTLSPGHTVTIFITDHHGSTFRDETWSIPGKVRHDPSWSLETRGGPAMATNVLNCSKLPWPSVARPRNGHTVVQP